MAWEPQTADDISSKWAKDVLKRFKEFHKVLTGPTTTIKDEFLNETALINGKAYRNFLELFIRPETAKLIVGIISTADDGQKIVNDVIIPFWENWDQLIRELESFYESSVDLQPVKSLYNTLRTWCQNFDGREGAFEELGPRYETYFNDFCMAFAHLPRRRQRPPSSSNPHTFNTPPRCKCRSFTLSPYARTIIDEKKSAFDKGHIQFKNSNIFFNGLTASKAWEEAIYLLLTTTDKDGWARLAPRWQQHFNKPPYKEFAQFIHPENQAKPGKASAGKSGNHRYRLMLEKRPIPTSKS